MSWAKWAKRRAMYAIDPVQKANRRYMVTSAEILPRTLDGVDRPVHSLSDVNALALGEPIVK